MKNKVLLSRLCICTLTVSLLAGCSSAGSTSETTNNSETESISSETASETSSESESATTASASFASLEKTDLFEQQNSIDEALQQEASAGYSFEEPNVIVNPYGNSPLTAVAAFHTDKELGGTVTVKGKDEKNDITGTFEGIDGDYKGILWICVSVRESCTSGKGVCAGRSRISEIIKAIP